MTSSPDCLRCRHFAITWERQHPRACKAYGFKSVLLPSLVVLRESGQPCSLYSVKQQTHLRCSARPSR